ncbi:MAG: hypothetical protein ACYTGN_11050 [Planctomycetota bacterium]|jgi:hypothetical protein
MQRTVSLLLVAVMLFETVALPVHAQDTGPATAPWPREFKAAKATIVLYQPQPESFVGDKLTGRAAVRVDIEGEEEPRFGAVWLEARVATDRDNRTVDLLELKVPKVAFVNAPEEKKQKLIELLERSLPKNPPAISLDRLMTSLENAEVKKSIAKGLKTDPPEIRFTSEPTEMVIIDGKPALRPMEGDTSMMKVINTMHLVVLHTPNKTYYLNLDQLWMQAADLEGPWTKATALPAKVSKLTPKPDPQNRPDDGVVPKIVVVDKAVQLIITDGEPKYTPVAGNELLYISNTDSSVFLEIASQRYFTLAAGRWFASKALKGPWTYVAADQLPAGFKRIAPESDVGDVRAFVAGTDEAKEAAMDAQIPQTATIKRANAELKVTYDGDPKFQAVQGVEKLAYATNCGHAVFLDQSGAQPVYYCCHDGVWYESNAPTGPWKTAIKVPDSVYTIPPSNPHYNTTYVRVYGYTSSVVYVGYLPGYTGCYVYNGTVVYGTGYTYTVWVGAVYYPYPVTYGYGYRYYPRVGRWFSPVSIGGVVRRTRRRTRRRTYHRTSHHHHHHHHHHNRYSGNKNRVQHQSRAQTGGSRTGKPSNRKNNHYADKKGNVHRQNNKGGFDKKNSGNKSGWSNSGKNKSMSKDSKARSRGSSRTSSYNRSRSGGSRGGGGRGGGGRRR